MKKTNPNSWLRWIARITGTLMVIFLLIMFIGEALEGSKKHEGSPFASVSPLILIIFVVWGVALAGLVVAWWKEGIGGMISLISYMLVYILNLFNKEAAMRWNAITLFLFLSLPAILYLIYWKLDKDEQKKVSAVNPE